MCWIYNLPTVAGSATLRSGWNLVAHAQRADLPASPKVLGKQGGWGGCSSCLLMCKWVVFTLLRLYCTSTTLVYIYICDIRKIHMVCIYIYTHTYSTLYYKLHIRIHGCVIPLLAKNDQQPWSVIPASSNCTPWTILRQVQQDLD